MRPVSSLHSTSDARPPCRAEPFEDAHARRRPPASRDSGREAQAVGGVPAVERFEFGVFGISHHDGHVGPLDVVAGEQRLQTLAGALVLGDDEDAARPLVEPMDDARSNRRGCRRVGVALWK